MKKIIVLIIMSVLLVSCGLNKESADENTITSTGLIENTGSVEMTGSTDTGTVLTEDEINAAVDDLFNSLDK